MSIAKEKSQHLFVYGTLLSTLQMPMGKYLSDNCNLEGCGYTQGLLYDLGEYPGLILSKDEKNQVFGEIYQIYDKVQILRRIDEYEGCSHKDPKPHLYERQAVSVRLTSEQDIMAWTYIYKGNLRTKPCIEGGDYTAYLAGSAKKNRFIKAR